MAQLSPRRPGEATDAAETVRQAALVRAARTLNETLDLNRVLVRTCEEAASILGSDYANVFLGNGREGLRLEATYGLPPEVIGGHVGPGEGLVGTSVERDEPMLANDHEPLSRQGSLAVPLHWDGELRGAVAVGWFEPVTVTGEQLGLLEAFADLAGAVCRNASAHAGLVLAARTDALTGCLNHAALHDTLRRELERCRRTGNSLSLAIVDLDDFKRINESQGHLVGDEVLRRVGDALRHAVRSYDLVARYGGDEFAIVAIDTGEREAAEVAERAIEGIGRAVQRVDGSGGSAGATAGIADWQGDESATALIARADRALLFGKQRGGRGTAVLASELPEDFRPVAGERERVVEAELEDGSALLAGQLEQARRAAADALAAALYARAGGAAPTDALERRAVEVGRTLGMDEAELGLLRLASRFHDVGKLALPDAILHKAAGLSAGERLEVERLPLASERILARVGFLDAVRGLIRHQHERWDGTGYPDGLSGERIPLASRVLFATGAYHAMLSDRPHRPALAAASARAELRSGSGTQFDPRVVAALLELLEQEDAAQEAVSESSESRQSRSTLAS